LILVGFSVVLMCLVQAQQAFSAQNTNNDTNNIFDVRLQNLTAWPNIHSNVKTDFNPNVTSPQIQASAFIHPFAVLIGDCYIGKLVLVAPTAVCRGDEGTPIHVGDSSNMQDGVVIHALETTDHGKNIDGRRFSASGDRLMGNDSRFSQGYAVFIGDRVSLAHDSMVHGPAWIGNDTFIGFKSVVYNARLGNNVAVGIGSTVTGGVHIDDDRFVPSGSVITNQEQADLLPPRVGSEFENLNKAVIAVNERIAEGLLAKAYDNQLANLIEQREKLVEENMLSIDNANINNTSIK
jgi:carbonic anhydrase/acetyltransferase-like protein (isoleucine patch superfamily)